MAPPEKTDRLNENIERLNGFLAKQTSIKRVFFMAVMSGVGGVIGATIVAGLIFFILSKFISSAEQIPIVGSIIKITRIESALNSRLDLIATPTPTITPLPTVTAVPTSAITPSPSITP